MCRRRDPEEINLAMQGMSYMVVQLKMKVESAARIVALIRGKSRSTIMTWWGEERKR